MILDAPVCAEITNIPRRKRNEVSTRVNGVVSISIPEIAVDNTTVVAWWTPNFLAPGMQMSIRSHDGALWQPKLIEVSVLDGIEISKPRSIADSLRPTRSKPGSLSSKIKVGGEVGEKKALLDRTALSELAKKRLIKFDDNSRGDPRSYWGMIDGEKLEDVLIASKSANTDNFDTEKKKVIDAFQDVIFIDDVLYEKLPAPVLVLTRQGENYEINAQNANQLMMRSDFRIYNLQEQEELSRDIANIPSTNISLMCMMPDIIHEDLLGHRHPLQLTALHLCHKIFNRFARPLGDVSFEAICAFYDVRDSRTQGVLAMLDALEKFQPFMNEFIEHGLPADDKKDVENIWGWLERRRAFFPVPMNPV